MATSGSNLSQEFFELLKAIGESKSKQEEDRIIQREVLTLKKKLETPLSNQNGSKRTGALPGRVGSLRDSLNGGKGNNLLQNKKKAKEFLVRLLYVEMLGHDGNFGYIKAVELAASSLITHKRVGYLVCSACLPPEHEFRFMLVNQMQRDLNSSHVLETCAALLAVSKIITSDMVPAISADVSKLLGHANETVRKKAIIALHRFHQIAPDCVTPTELIEKLRRVLCDRDPSVMGASLNVIHCMAQKSPAPFKDLVPSLISILKQICEHRLPSDFDYHRVPAPWMQMHIIRILAILGKADANVSSGMYEILGDCMRKADVGINAGYAITYECIRTITTIYPNPTLLDAAAQAITNFITSRSQNLKYLGVTGLANIVEQHPQYAAAHQIAVIECLEDPDDTLQRKTLDLLYRMTNPVNVEFITQKLLQFLKGTTDPFLKESLTGRICTIAERYAPTNVWYINVITELMEISGDMVREDVAQNLMSLVAEGTGADADTDGLETDEDLQLRIQVVDIYTKLLKKPKLPKVLAETMAWVLGEYAYLSQEHDLNYILDQLCILARKSSTVASSSTRNFLATAIMKLVAQAGTCPPNAAHIIDEFTKSRDVDLQQRSLEFQNLLTNASHILGDVLPVDASCEDVEADEELRFLDSYVNEALQSGARPYAPPDDDDDDDYDDLAAADSKPAFNFTAYEKPKPVANVGFLGSASSQALGQNTSQPYATAVNLPPGANKLGTSINETPMSPGGGQVIPSTTEPQLVLRSGTNVWGKGGMSNIVQQTPAAPMPSTMPSSSSNTNSNYNIQSQQNSYQPSSQPEKPKEMTEKEKMAAALFGGIVPGTSAPMSSTAAPQISNNGSTTSVPKPVSAPKPAPAPKPTPAPAPAPPLTHAVAMDLLDFSDPGPVAAPAPAEPSLAMMLDPFSAPPASTSTAQTFAYQNMPLVPLTYTTPQFGSLWGTLASTSPNSVPLSSNSYSLDALMQKLSLIGLHSVEAISATAEGIAAGKCNDKVVLVHGKVNVGVSKIDLTVKCDDSQLGSSLSSFLANNLIS